MEPYLIFKFVHFLGILLWVAGQFVWVKSFKIFADLEQKGTLERADILPTLKPVHLFAQHLGMGLTLIGGIGMMALNPAIAKGGWIHAKLAIVAILMFLTILMTRKSKQFAAGAPIELGPFLRSSGKWLVVILILAVLRPF